MSLFLARLFLRLTGWQPEGERPEPAKFVLIAAPHTTNWDFPFTLAFARVFNLKILWMGKHTLFKGPLGPIMRRLGGLPIQRHLRKNVVEQTADLLRNAADELVITVPAEGTRSRVEYWKSGFYHIARAADVPIVLGYLDYKRKRGGFGAAIKPTGDLKADMDLSRAFYADKVGKYPENFGPVRLREEDELEAGSNRSADTVDASAGTA